MKKYPWNDYPGELRTFWDTDRGGEISKYTSLKESLQCPNGRKLEDALRDCCSALVMIMDYLEKEGNRK